MKNIIKINVNNPYYFDIENIDNGTNSIYVKFSNFTDTGTCEVYYGDAYYREIELDASGAAEIPAECYSDGANMHLRYENGTITGFIHITGDGSKYENVALVAVSNCIAAITGSENKVITDYGAALAEIISGHTPADNKSCYNDLSVYRKLLISSINSMGGSVEDNATVEDITYSLMGLDASLAHERATVAAGRVLIAEAITNKGVDTSPTDTAEVMAANIEKIESGGGTGFDKNLRIISFYDNDVTVAQYAGLPNDYIMSPLNSDGKSYGGWEDINGEFIKFPMKINEDVDLYRASKLYDLNGSSLWENGWTYSSEPTRNIKDEYIGFLKKYTNSSDEKNVIQTVNKYDLTNARILRFILNVTDDITYTYNSDYPMFWAMLLPSKNTQWGLNNYSLKLVGADIVEGTYDVDLTSISGEYYIAFSCQHKNTKADIRISNIEVYR